MQFLHNRIQSFEDEDLRWPHPIKGWTATPETLAKAGFYYDPIAANGKSTTGESDDRVACYVCNVVISNWRSSQDPMARHRQEYIECAVVTSQRGDCRLTGNEAKTARRNTFGKWWPHRATLPDGSRFRGSAFKLAEAGFCYNPTAKHEDNVTCPWCELSAHGWSKNDTDPMELHKERSPECPFILELSGREQTRSSAVAAANSTVSSPVSRALFYEPVSAKRGTSARNVSKPSMMRTESDDSIDEQSRRSGTVNTPLSASASKASLLGAPKSSSSAARDAAAYIPKESRRKPVPNSKYVNNDDFDEDDDKMETVIAIEAPPPPNVRNYRVSTAVKKRKLIDGMEPVDPRRNSIVSATSAASPLARPAGKIHETINQLIALGQTLRHQVEHDEPVAAKRGDDPLKAAQLRIAELSGANTRLIDQQRSLQNELDALYSTIRADPRKQVAAKATSAVAPARSSSDDDSQRLINSLLKEKSGLTKSLEAANQRLHTSTVEYAARSAEVHEWKERCTALSANYETAKKENDVLRGMGFSPAPAPLATPMRLAAIAALAPDERRLWYEGEHYLLEVRLGFIAPSGTVLSLVNVSFLTCGDVPWPVSPTTPLTTPITSTMISNFLLAGLSGDEYRLVKQRLEYRFHSDRVQQWLPCIAERDQAKTVQRAQQVMKALAQL